MRSTQQRAAARAPRLPLVELLDAIRGWQVARSPAARRSVAEALAALADLLGLPGLRISVDGPLLAPITVGTGTLARGRAQRDGVELRAATDGARLGWLWADGPPRPAIQAVAMVLDAERGQHRARRAEQNLAALDAAIGGIGGVLSLERVLQLIVDNVRELADARYAALGIVNDEGDLERFLTAGMSATVRRRIGHLPRGRGLLGLVVTENRVIRVRDIATHPRRYGFPSHHPPMHSFLGVPVMVRGRSVGNLYLTEKRGAPDFTNEDQLLVERFARHAGLAIENARLGERIQQLAVVDERERIGRDLHDGVIQRLYAVTLGLDDVPAALHDRPDEAAREVDAAITQLQAAIEEIREFIHRLGGPIDAAADLGGGLEALADEVRAHAGLEVEVDLARDPGLSPEASVELLSIVREALSNIVRHADARRILVRGRRRGGADLVVQVIDDGHGFAVGGVGPGHHGLHNMERRAERAGGAFEVRSSVRGGTRIIVTLPLPKARIVKEGSESP